MTYSQVPYGNELCGNTIKPSTVRYPKSPVKEDDQGRRLINWLSTTVKDITLIQLLKFSDVFDKCTFTDSCSKILTQVSQEEMNTEKIENLNMEEFF